MNSATLGKTIARLRKSKKLTQAALAKHLNISDKTVSKWESGAGYPEITQLPALAKTFNVTVDYLINGGDLGITIAGNMLTDNVKIISAYPKEGMLTSILREHKSVGGCAPNTAIDIAKIDPDIPVSVCGLIGNDDNGRYIINQMQSYGINTGRVHVSYEHQTSYSDVMSVESTGFRTFFHNAGANRAFSPDDIDINTLDCSIFHIGYILLLDMFDRPDPEYGTVMARFLSCLREKGIKTSIDVVSDSSEKFREKVMPVLAHCDYAVMNEIEAGGVSGLDARNPDGSINIGNIRRTLELFIEYGVKDTAVIHCPEGGFSYSSAGEFNAIASLKLPKGYIKGSTGAGDAFCAACLYCFYKNIPHREMLEFASCAAACNLAASDSVSGMKNKNEIYKMNNEMERMKKCW